MEISTPADDPTAPPPPVTDADIQKTITLAPQYGLTFFLQTPLSIKRCVRTEIS